MDICCKKNFAPAFRSCFNTLAVAGSSDAALAVAGISGVALECVASGRHQWCCVGTHRQWQAAVVLRWNALAVVGISGAAFVKISVKDTPCLS